MPDPNQRMAAAIRNRNVRWPGTSQKRATVPTDPVRLIVPMLERFIATDRAFAKARRTTTMSARLA
ncbi:DUF2274 domain-containing protein [uncultured Celeribacter sp.]|uniref:DUF2274 domain-containing protein n=1 Tax=uncultured Celeribacter sp. TaxID=1303376 RepID=UPI003748ADF2